MFTEQDYRDYFAALQNAERQMIKSLNEILLELSDVEVKKILNNVRNDEFRHLKLEDELFAVLERK